MRKHGTPHRRALAALGQVAGRELQPAASAWRHKRGPYHPSLAQEKVKIQSLKQFLLNGRRVRTAVKSRNPKWNRCQLGTVCTLRNESLKPREEASAGDGNRGAAQIEGVVGAARGAREAGGASLSWTQVLWEAGRPAVSLRERRGAASPRGEAPSPAPTFRQDCEVRPEKRPLESRHLGVAGDLSKRSYDETVPGKVRSQTSLDQAGVRGE